MSNVICPRARYKHNKAISGHSVPPSDSQNKQPIDNSSSSEPNEGHNRCISKQEWDSVMGKMSQFDTLSSPSKIKCLKTTHSDFQSTDAFDNKQGMTEATDEFGQKIFSGLVYPNMTDITREDSILQDVGIESTISAPNNLLPVHTQCVLSTNSEPDLDGQQYFEQEGFHQQQMLSLGQKSILSSNNELKPVSEISSLQPSSTMDFLSHNNNLLMVLLSGNRRDQLIRHIASKCHI